MKSQRQPVSRVAGFLFISCLLGTVISAQSLPPSRVLDLSAADGTKLKATYFGAGKPGPGVLLLHQCNRQRKVWDALAQQLAAAGINVLTLDYRGFGESGGDRFDKLPQEKAAQVIGEKWPGDIDHQLLEKCQTLAASRIGRNSRFRFKNKLMSLDATVIDRCASVFDWAQFRRTKGAVKLHLLLDHNGHLPAFAVVTEGKKHEIQVAQWSFVSEARGSSWRYSD